MLITFVTFVTVVTFFAVGSYERKSQSRRINGRTILAQRKIKWQQTRPRGQWFYLDKEPVADFNNKRNLTQPLRKWHRSNLTSACKSICRQEGETEHFTIKNRLPLFGQPLIARRAKCLRYIIKNKVTLWSAIYSTCVVYTKTSNSSH